MAQKVETACKMKSRQETTSLGQIATVDGKADNKRQAFINTNKRHFKIQMGDMEPSPGSASIKAMENPFFLCVDCWSFENKFSHLLLKVTKLKVIQLAAAIS